MVFWEWVKTELFHKLCICASVTLTFLGLFNPFPNERNFDSSKLKQFADDSFKSDNNDINLSIVQMQANGTVYITQVLVWYICQSCLLRSIFAPE